MFGGLLVSTSLQLVQELGSSQSATLRRTMTGILNMNISRFTEYPNVPISKISHHLKMYTLSGGWRSTSSVQ